MHQGVLCALAGLVPMLECPICNDVIDELNFSTSRACPHVFCGSCIDRHARVHARDDKQEVKSTNCCPMCRAYTHAWTHVRADGRELANSPEYNAIIPSDRTKMGRIALVIDGAQAVDGGVRACSTATVAETPEASMVIRAADTTTAATVAETPEASMVARPRQTSKNKRKRCERERGAALLEKGGCDMVQRGVVRSHGVAVPVGGYRRTCLPDALWVCLSGCGKLVDLAIIRAALCPKESDPSYTMANIVASTHGVRMTHIPGLSRSPKGLFRQTSGMFLVCLHLIWDKEDEDHHYVAYDASSSYLIDNTPRLKVPKVQTSDTKNNKEAIKVFFKLFKEATKIVLCAVSKLTPRDEINR